MSEVTAKLTRYGQSPRKAGLVAGLIKGKTVEQALKELGFLNKRAAGPFAKLINSASANAKHNFGLDPQELYIKKIVVDKGIVMKRSMPRAFGRAAPIRKRTSNISLVLDSKK